MNGKGGEPGAGETWREGRMKATKLRLRREVQGWKKRKRGDRKEDRKRRNGNRQKRERVDRSKVGKEGKDKNGFVSS